MNSAPVPESKSPLVIDYRLPHPALDRWVSHYYLLARRDKHDLKPILQRMYPSDGTGLIFQLAGHADILSPDGQWRPHPRAFAKGHFRKPFLARFQGAYQLLCVSFRPGMAHHFLRDSQAAINDKFVPLEALFGRAGGDLAEQVLIGGKLTQIGPLLDRFLIERAPSARNASDCLTHAVSQIILTNGAVSVGKVAEMCGQNPRRIERRFRSTLGMTPKYFCETVRFRAFLRRVRVNPNESAAARAQECGYFDQAHQIREFRKFTGTCPGQFWSQAEAIEAATTDIRTFSTWISNASR